jgi:predicted transcriptional regulator
MANKMKNFTAAKFKKLYYTVTQQELADLMGVSQPAIVYYAKKFGLTSKSKAKKVRWS